MFIIFIAGVTRSLASAPRNSGSPSRPEISTNNSTNLNSSTKYDRPDTDAPANCLDCRVNITLSTSSKLTPLSSTAPPESKPGVTACVLCPLCRHECADSTLLESHLVKEHNVATEGVQRLMSMVDMPASMASSESFASSLPTQPAPGDNILTATTFPLPLSGEATLSTNTASKSEAILSRRSSKQTGSQNDNNPEQNGNDKLPASTPKSVSSTGQSNTDIQSSINLQPASVPSSPCSTISLMPFAAHVTSSPTFVSSSSNQNALSDNRMNLPLSPNDEDKEINLQSLEAEHANLLASEGKLHFHY